jgi:hypothetical protein
MTSATEHGFPNVPKDFKKYSTRFEPPVLSITAISAVAS